MAKPKYMQRASQLYNAIEALDRSWRALRGNSKTADIYYSHFLRFRAGWLAALAEMKKGPPWFPEALGGRLVDGFGAVYLSFEGFLEIEQNTRDAALSPGRTVDVAGLLSVHQARRY